MPRPSMIPTVQGKLIYLLQWAEREGYVYVAAELRYALRMLGEKEIPPHPVPPEIREAVSEYLAREFPGQARIGSVRGGDASPTVLAAVGSLEIALAPSYPGRSAK